MPESHSRCRRDSGADNVPVASLDRGSIASRFGPCLPDSGRVGTGWNAIFIPVLPRVRHPSIHRRPHRSVPSPVPEAAVVRKSPLLPEQFRRIASLRHLAIEILRERTEIDSWRDDRLAAARQTRQTRLDTLARRIEADEAIIRANAAGRRRILALVARRDRDAASGRYSSTIRGIDERVDRLTEEAGEVLREASWETTTVQEARTVAELADWKALGERIETLLQGRDDLRRVLDERRSALGPTWAVPPRRDAGLPTPSLASCPAPEDLISEAHATLDRLDALALPRILAGAFSMLLALGSFVVASVPMAKIAGVVAGPALAAIATVTLSRILVRKLRSVAASQVERVLIPLWSQFELLDAEIARLDAMHRQGRQGRQGQLDRFEHEKSEALSRARLAYTDRIRSIRSWGERRRSEADEDRSRQLDLVDRYEPYYSARIERQLARRLDAIAAFERRKREAIEGKFREKGEATEAERASRIARCSRRWESALEETRPELPESDPRTGDRVDPWPEILRDSWEPPAQEHAHLRIGRVCVEIPDPSAGPSGAPIRFVLPALLPIDEGANLLLEAADPASRIAALDALRAIMFGLLAGMPPGRVRFSIIDPAGLGHNFAAFMQLAEFDPKLVSHQIRTEPGPIEECLAGISAHIEGVIQRHLRTQDRTIRQHNAAAGELAEPYHVLVIADFPSGLTESAAERIARIAAGGPRCGVLTLIVRDTGRPFPNRLDPDDLHRVMNRISLARGEARWQSAPPDELPLSLSLDRSPDDETGVALLRKLGALAREAGRVMVPFESIAPPFDQWWAADSRTGIEVGLGKAGSTRTQHLCLGRGTSQHVLVAGRTGSGKSTLLHALITNLALKYAPDELEFYLVDFKKGVEFKGYATGSLPHAAVIAIESEREFGVSVLQRLDEELRTRGECFRAAGAQDLAAYRTLTGAAMPRVLLIVDEFQEFFVEDDRLAQEAGLLLDRLVRQGRAFGLHVLLGSQTLGGAYALARSTLGQMAVRIALQCSASDAHLILSDVNTSAHFLSRPGEAIYNDANGHPEGNQPFQVVWISNEQRDRYLKGLRDLAAKRGVGRAREPVVFEGNRFTRLEENPLLRRLLAAAPDAHPGLGSTVWLGDPVAIKDPTGVTFRRHAGSNLLIVGRNEPAARSLIASAIICISIHHPPASRDGRPGVARVYLLDGLIDDDPAGDSLADLASRLPHLGRLGGPRDARLIVSELAGEVQRRIEGAGDCLPRIILVVRDLQRFRDFVRRDDDFGYTRDPQPAHPADLFSLIIREGPGLNMHVILWAESMNTLRRSFGTRDLREFESRVVFRMSVDDSTSLIDHPAGGKLGEYQAILYRDDQASLERFRPYGFPGSEWPDLVAHRWSGPGLLPPRPTNA